MDDLVIREESVGDVAAIRHINERAFGQQSEARLVDALRGDKAVTLSLVAECGGVVVGHILFSPAHVVAGEAESDVVALAPMAVLPEHQRSGVGSALILEGLARLRDAGHGLLVVLGHSEYYPRFGFVRASRLDIRCPFDVPDEAYMAIELREDTAPAGGGEVRYHGAFGAVT